MLYRLMREIHSGIYQRRVEVLADMIVPLLRPEMRILDVGAGGGGLGAAVLNHARCPSNVVYEGLESRPRPDAVIPVHAYEGGTMPFNADSYDLVIVADVLHHEKEPARLLKECIRVSRRRVLVKDHRQENLLDWCLISALDFAANGPYGVPCLFRYFTGQQWRELFSSSEVQLDTEVKSIDLYPPGWNQIFGGRLQYFAVLEKKQD